jgi:hypothetical protein
MVARSGLHATSIRAVQLIGRKSDGAWAPLEWMPLKIKLMTTIGIIPDLSNVRQSKHLSFALS